MSIKKSQLKDEKLVDGSVITENVNPSTTVRSVVDDSSGEDLSKVLDDIRNAINNKMTRNVNSVNGKTGVVIINAADIGLGNVSNVSYGDIQKWVIDKINKAFGEHLPLLLNNLDEVDAICADNDRIYENRPYYTRTGRPNPGPSESPDYRAYIGYFIWEEEQLVSINMPIEVVGCTDKSINYNDGKVSVNIWQGQDIIKVHDGDSSSDPGGLYLDEDKLGAHTKVIDCVHGKSYSTGSPALYDDTLIYPPQLVPTDADYYKLDIGTLFTNLPLYNNQMLKMNDVVLFNFRGGAISTPSDASKFNMNLFGRPPIIGHVSQVPDPEDYSTNYIITIDGELEDEFSWGTEKIVMKRGENGVPFTSHVNRVHSGMSISAFLINSDYPSEVGARGATSWTSYKGRGFPYGTGNYSGLNVLAKSFNDLSAGSSDRDSAIYSKATSMELPPTEYGPWVRPDVKYHPDIIHNMVNTPSGADGCIGGGLQIFTDPSICVNPLTQYGEGSRIISSGTPSPDPSVNYESAYASNYHTLEPINPEIGRTDPDIKTYSHIKDLKGIGITEPMSLLGVNLEKHVIQEDFDNTYPPSFLNISGLRIVDPKEKLNALWYGMCESETGLHPNIPFNPRDWSTRKRLHHEYDDIRCYNVPYYQDIPESSSYYDGDYIDGAARTILKTTESLTEYYGEEGQTKHLINRKGENSRHSGGLAVNVGDYLEIGLSENVPSDMKHYFDSGKVNVRLGNGLCGEPIEWLDDDDHSLGMIAGNRIQVAFDPLNSGLKFVPVPDTFPLRRGLALNLKENGGLAIDEEGQLYTTGGGGGGGSADVPKLVIKDVYNTEFVYNSEGSTTVTLMLGDGLMLVDDGT